MSINMYICTSASRSLGSTQSAPLQVCNYIYMYSYIYIYLFIGPPVYQCGEHWSGGPGSLVRGAKEKLSIEALAC